MDWIFTYAIAYVDWFQGMGWPKHNKINKWTAFLEKMYVAIHEENLIFHTCQFINESVYKIRTPFRLAKLSSKHKRRWRRKMAPTEAQQKRRCCKQRFECDNGLHIIGICGSFEKSCFVLICRQEITLSTCCLCTWWRLWYLHWRRVLPIHQAARVWQQFEFHEM